jgi:hypothetical protein
MARIASRFPYCYYAAPKFTTKGDLDYLFDKKRVLASSIIAKLDQFPPVRRGVANRHRIVAPIGFDSHFVFSEPSAHRNVDMRRELRSIWTSWESDRPLADTLEEVWRWAPRGNKTRAIAHARREIAMLRQLPPEPEYFAESSDLATERLPPPTTTETGTQLAVPTKRRRPPWPAGTFRPLEMSAAYGEELDHMQRMTAISYLLDLLGVQMSIVQPSEKALD